MTDPDETNLIADARHGSTRAFEALYRMHSGRVYGLCVRLAGNPADAQDATQETFIKAWSALDAFRGGSAFSTWLHRIAFNEVMGLKRRHRSEDRNLRVVGENAAAADASLPELDRLERAIAALPDRAREALVLHKIYGYTHEETAEFMETAVGTCKAQVHRALQLLRDALPNPSPSEAPAPAPDRQIFSRTPYDE